MPTSSLARIVREFQDLLQIKLYLVGGSVRDRLMNLPHTDLDFATSSKPDEIEAAIRAVKRRPYLTGKRFGTVAFRHEGDLVEITTFRTEKYSGSRKPEVEFVRDIVQDLSRRDFTVNAMAVDDKGKLIDPFSGYADLTAEKIRFVGNPTIRINEDPLRMLRACRLSAQFAFVPTTETKEKIRENAVKILKISHERWTSELDKILTSTHPHRGLDALAQTELLRYILPEIWIQVRYDQNSPYHGLSLFEHTKKTVELTQNDVLLRWAALLHDIGKPFARIDKTVRPGLFTVDALKNWTRYWSKDTQSNYPHHAELGAEFVEKVGHYLKWSNDRVAKIKTLVLEHLKQGHSPLEYADGAAR